MQFFCACRLERSRHVPTTTTRLGRHPELLVERDERKVIKLGWVGWSGSRLTNRPLLILAAFCFFSLSLRLFYVLCCAVMLLLPLFDSKRKKRSRAEYRSVPSVRGATPSPSSSHIHPPSPGSSLLFALLCSVCIYATTRRGGVSTGRRKRGRDSSFQEDDKTLCYIHL